MGLGHRCPVHIIVYQPISTDRKNAQNTSREAAKQAVEEKTLSRIMSVVSSVVNASPLPLPCRVIHPCVHHAQNEIQKNKTAKTHQTLCVKAIPTANGNRFQSKISGPPWPATASSARRMRRYIHHEFKSRVSLNSTARK